MSKPASTTPGVQISMTIIGDGAPVTSAWLVRQIIADLAGFPGWLPEVEDAGDGLWLVELPTGMYQEADEDGGLFLTHSAGYAVEIPIP